MAIEVKKLKKNYKVKKCADVRVLKGISFNLPDKGMVFILGKSGCGKSTLLNVLGGLDGFDGGDIVIDGKSIKGYTARDLDRYRNDYIGFVFQEHNLIEKESVRRNVSLALDLQSSKDTEGKVDGVLESVGLKDLAEQKCNCISGGQKQRVAIARALIKQPKLLLCDEPTGALDSETGKEIFTLLKELSQERLVVIVSHDRESAEKYGDRVIELKDGEIISDNAPYELPEQPQEKPAEKKHGRLRFTRAFTMGAGYIIAKPVRMAICLLLCLITFACVGVADVVKSYDVDKTILKAMEESGSKCYTFGKAYKDYRYGYDLNDLGMSLEDADELSSLLDVERCDYMYYFNGWQDNVGGTGDVRLKYMNATGYVEADEKFLKDYGFTLLAGRLPENTGEVAIPEFTFRFFKSYGYKNDKGKITEINSYSDLIGKQIMYNSYPVTLTVTGIVDTYFRYDEKTDFLFSDVPFGAHGYDNGLSGMQNILLDGVQEMLFVCKGYKDYIYENFQVTEEYAVKKVIAPYKGSRAQKLKNIRVYTTQYGGEPVDEKYGYCYHLISYGAYLGRGPEETLSAINPYLPYVIAVLVVINVLFLTYYASGTIDEKRREIGILRALGASRGDIVKITASEHGIFTLGTVAISSAVGAIVASVLNKKLCTQFLADFVFLSLGIRQVALVLAVAVLSVVAGIAFPLIKLLKAKPVDVIADRK